MLIGIISDTHDNGRPILRSVEVFNERNVDMVLHCGDWDMPFTLQWYGELRCPIKGVLGNGDADIQKFWRIFEQQCLKLDLELDMHFLDLTLDHQRIGVVHGDSEPLLKFIIESQMFDVLCYGHNHQAEIKKKGRTLLINPGTLVGVNLPQTKEHPYTIAVYDTTTKSAELIEL